MPLVFTAAFAQAMAIVTERLSAQKPQQVVDPKSNKALVNNNKDLDVEAKKDEGSFFGSFFAKTTGAAGTQKKKNPGVMEAPPAIIRPQQALSERETMETEVIKLLIHSYFNIVKREMIDMIPKAITYTLVNHAKEDLQRELLQELYKPEVLDELLKESEYVINRRKEVVAMVQALNKAEEYVSSIFCPLLLLTSVQDCFQCVSWGTSLSRFVCSMLLLIPNHAVLVLHSPTCVLVPIEVLTLLFLEETLCTSLRCPSTSTTAEPLQRTFACFRRGRLTSFSHHPISRRCRTVNPAAAADDDDDNVLPPVDAWNGPCFAVAHAREQPVDGVRGLQHVSPNLPDVMFVELQVWT